MARIHAPELEDQAWFPDVLRNILTDSLQFGMTTFGYYDKAAPLVRRLLHHMGTTQVLDLASGGTGPWLRLREQLRADGGPDVRITFTDRNINENARARVRALRDPRLHYVETPVDAARVPANLEGVRTMFTGFHHLGPDEARQVLRDAVAARRAIGIFEFTDRSVRSLAMNALVPLAMWLTTPFIAPRTPERFLFTYALPVGPIAGAWDGFMSCLRTYSPAELEALVPEESRATFTWEVGRIPPEGGSPPLTYLLGLPRFTRGGERKQAA